MKKKTYISILTALLLILGITIFVLISTIQNMPQEQTKVSEYSYTKAICEGDTCQDYVILCNGQELISQTPITGAQMKIPSGWEDPRPQELVAGFCTLA